MSKERDFLSDRASEFDESFGLAHGDSSKMESQRVMDDSIFKDSNAQDFDSSEYQKSLGMTASDKKVPKEKLGSRSSNDISIDKKPSGAFAPAHTLPPSPSTPKELGMTIEVNPLTHDEKVKLDEFNRKKEKARDRAQRNPTTIGGMLGVGDVSMGIGGLSPKRRPQSTKTNFLSPGSPGDSPTSSGSGKAGVGRRGGASRLGSGSTIGSPQRDASSRYRSQKTLDGYKGESPSGKSKVSPTRRHDGGGGSKGGPMFSLFPGFNDGDNSSFSLTGMMKKKAKRKVQATLTILGLLLFLFIATFSIIGQYTSQQEESDRQSLDAASAISSIGMMEEAEVAALMESMRNQGGSPRTESSGGDEAPVIDDDDGDGDTRRRVDSDSEADLYAGQSDGGGPSEVEGFTKRQLENYTVAYNTAVDEGLTEKGILNVMMVITTESRGWNLANDGSHPGLKGDQDPAALRESLDHPQSDGLPSEHGYGHGGDHGSVGIMQQQFPWWGTIEQLMDREFATRKFITEMKKVDYENMPSGQAIQSVQRSFDPTGSNYTREEGVARSIMEAIEKDR